MAVVARAAALDGAGEAAAGEQRVDRVVARLGERTAGGARPQGQRRIRRTGARPDLVVASGWPA